MATPQKKKEEEEEEKKAKAEEFLDERRVLDGQERFWSQDSEVGLRILAVEEKVKNSPEGQDWNPRYLLEAKAELERRGVELEKGDKRKRREEESRKQIKEGNQEVKERLRKSGEGVAEWRRIRGRGAVRPQLKNIMTESAKVSPQSIFSKCLARRPTHNMCDILPSWCLLSG